MAKWSRSNREEYNKTRREWYRKNAKSERKRLRKSNKKREAERIIWWEEYKSSLKCSKCLENHPGCLEFHHKNSEEKEHNVANMIKSYSKSKILEEIKKCDILCANCHRKLHYELFKNKPQ